MKGRIICLKRQLKYFEKQLKELKKKEIKKAVADEIIFYERYIRWLKKEIKQNQDNW